MSTTSWTESTNDADALSTTVVNAIAEHEGVDPTELDRPLYDVIDPDALDALFLRSTGGDRAASGCLVFSYQGCEVRVTDRGDVRVSDAGER